MQPDPRRAIVERRESIANEPRPAPLSTEDISVRVAEVRETDDVFRLYRPEWVVVYVLSATSRDSDGRPLLDQVRDYFAAKYAGRVREDDVRYDSSGEGIHELVMLMLRLPTMKGEFKYAFLAQRYADECGYGDFDIVARNAKADHDLRSYGIRKLPREAS